MSCSPVRLLVTLWTAAHRAPPSMGFSRQEYWSGVPLPSPLPLLTKTLIPSNQGPPLQPPACVLGCFSHVPLFVTPRTVAHQAPLSMGFSRQEYQSVLPCPPPGDLPNPETEPASLKCPAKSRFFTSSTTWEAPEMKIRLGQVDKKKKCFKEFGNDKHACS